MFLNIFEGVTVRKNKFFIVLLFGIALLSACVPGDEDASNVVASLDHIEISPIDGREMVFIPAGEFVMGTDRVDEEKMHLKIGAVKPLFLDQHPERTVQLDAFYIDRYEVTNAEYKRFIDDSGYNDLPANWVDGVFPEGKENYPVTHITWDEALTYALWAGKRLPSEAQWEKAARGDKGGLYPWGNEYVKGYANVNLDGSRELAPIGSYPKDKSPYGVFDMGGNVMEWTRNWYKAYPGNTRKDNRFGEKFKALRGGAFQRAGHYFLDAYLFSFARTEADPDGYYENVGFRCVKELPEKIKKES